MMRGEWCPSYRRPADHHRQRTACPWYARDVMYRFRSLELDRSHPVHYCGFDILTVPKAKNSTKGLAGALPNTRAKGGERWH